jgi:anti-sigma regulatory factor (Ser/Thr protein kinase)
MSDSRERLGGERPRPLQGLARAAREAASDPNPAHALWKLVCALRRDLAIDRAGVFAFDPTHDRVDHITGVDARGLPEFSAQSFPVSGQHAPLQQVVRRELPYYFTDDVRRDYPSLSFDPGVRAQAVIPILVSDRLVGALCIDNCLSDKPIPETVLEPLLLYASLAALPLFALYQQRERDRLETIRWHIYREVLLAVTGGRMVLCTQSEIDAEWPPLDEPVSIAREDDVRGVREAARLAGVDAGMTEERAMDLGLCASEGATNALLHGNGGAAVVEYRESRVRVRIQDHGEGILPEDLPRATLLKGWSKRASMGLGFTVINETADRIYLSTGPEGTTLIIEMGVQPDIHLPDESNPLLWGEDLSLSVDCSEE